MLDTILILAVLVAGFVILGARIGRKLEDLEEGQRKASAEDALGDLRDRIESLESSLERSRERPEIDAAVRTMDRLAGELRATVGALGAARREAEGSDLADRIRARLADDDFQLVKILSETPDVRPDGSSRIGLEAKREGVRFKGHVIVRSGEPTETKLEPILGVFP